MLGPVLPDGRGHETGPFQKLTEHLWLVGVFHVLLAAAPPEPALPLEEIHAVDDGGAVLVEIGPPEAEQVVALVDEDLPVQRAEPFRRMNVKQEKAVGADEIAQAEKDRAQRLKGDVVAMSTRPRPG